MVVEMYITYILSNRGLNEMAFILETTFWLFMLEWKTVYLIQNLYRFVPNDPVDNDLALNRVMAWKVDKHLSSNI